MNINTASYADQIVAACVRNGLTGDAAEDYALEVLDRVCGLTEAQVDQIMAIVDANT